MAALSVSPWARKAAPIHGFGLIDVEMHIAVADMAEGDGARAREHLRAEIDRPGNERRHTGDGDGDVMLDADAGVFLQFDDTLAHKPQLARLLGALGNGCVGEVTILERCGEGGFPAACEDRCLRSMR